jgi:hypothetical protein
MTNITSVLNSALTNATAVSRAAIKKEKSYLDGRFQVVAGIEQKAGYQALLLELGKMYVASKDNDKDSSVAKTCQVLRLIVKYQEAPELQAKCVAIIDVAAKAFLYLKQISPSFLQKALSSLVLAKKTLLIGHQYAEGQLKVEIADKERNKFFTLANRDPNKKKDASGFRLSPLVFKAAADSLEAFALFASMGHLKDEPWQVSLSQGKLILDMPFFAGQLTPLKREKLLRYKDCSNEHLRMIARAFLSWDDMKLALQQRDKIADGYGQFVQREKIQQVAQNPFLKQFMPEFVDLWDVTYAYALRCMRELQLNPENENSDPLVLQEQMNFWTLFLRSSEPRHFTYEFFYSALQQLKSSAKNEREFIATYYKTLSALNPTEPLPDPIRFAAWSLEKSEATTPLPPTAAAGTATAVDSKDHKTPPVVQKKKKVDSIARYLREPPAESLDVKSKDAKERAPVASSGSSTATAAATAAAPPHPLASVFAMGKSFVAQRTYDQRVDLWLTSPTTAVESATYAGLSKESKEAAMWRHGFTPLLDYFLGTRYCTTGAWSNPTTKKTDALHCLLVEVEAENGAKERCVLQYCEDENHVIYHRFAGLTSNQELVDRIVTKKLFEVLDFPAWGISKQTMKSGPSTKPIAIELDGENITMDPASEIVTVYDSVYKRTFRVIPLN